MVAEKRKRDSSMKWEKITKETILPQNTILLIDCCGGMNLMGWRYGDFYHYPDEDEDIDHDLIKYSSTHYMIIEIPELKCKRSNHSCKSIFPEKEIAQ